MLTSDTAIVEEAVVPEISHTARSPRRPAFVSFVLAEVVAFFIFYRQGLRGWFNYDDWDFLAARTAGDLHGLLVPHGDHWETVSILVYRLLWQLFGLRYGPYLITAILLHLGTAALLRVVMVRAGASPWIATTAASLFAMFGVGYESTTRLIALNFSDLSVVLGLTHALLADHDGRWDRRDWLGLAAGLAALGTGAVGVPMIVAAGATALIRRRFRPALAHTLPLVAVFVAWYVSFASKGQVAPVRGIATFVHTALRGVLVDLGQFVVVAVVLGVVLVVGLFLAWRPPTEPQVRRTAAVPAGLLIALLAFVTITATGRAINFQVTAYGNIARLSHYMEVAAALILPALAVAATAIARRVGRLALVIPLLFLVGIPGNLQALEHDVAEREELQRQMEAIMLSLPRSPLAADAPADLMPEPILSGPVTIGWLRDSLAAGRIPKPKNTRGTDDIERQNMVRLLLRQTRPMTDFAPCFSPTKPVVRQLEAGGHLSLGDNSYASVELLTEDGWTPPVRFGQPFTTRHDERLGMTLTSTWVPLTIRIRPEPGVYLWLCG